MPTPDNFENYASGLESPIERIVEVTPHDTNDLAFQPRAIRVNVAGLVALEDQYGNSVIIEVAAGLWDPTRPVKILATGTTATGIFIGQ